MFCFSFFISTVGKWKTPRKDGYITSSIISIQKWKTMGKWVLCLGNKKCPEYRTIFPYFFLDFLFVSKPTLWSVGPLNFVNSYFFCFLGGRRRKEREKEKSFLLGMNSFKCRLKTRILTHDPFFAAVLSSHFFVFFPHLLMGFGKT